jgi:hypothetical protein
MHCCFIYIICAKMQLYIVVLSILFVFRDNYTLQIIKQQRIKELSGVKESLLSYY